jgi:prophage regulatory protein
MEVSMRVLRFPELKERLGIPYSRVHVDRLEKAGQFPRRIKIGVNSVGWLESELTEWLRARMAARDAAA